MHDKEKKNGKTKQKTEKIKTLQKTVKKNKNKGTVSLDIRSMISDLSIKLRNVYTNFLHRLMVLIIAIIEASKTTRKLNWGGYHVESDRSSLKLAKSRPKS